MKVCAGRAIVVIAHSTKTAYAFFPQLSLPNALTIRFVDALLIRPTPRPPRRRSLCPPRPDAPAAARAASNRPGARDIRSLWRARAGALARPRRPWGRRDAAGSRNHMRRSRRYAGADGDVLVEHVGAFVGQRHHDARENLIVGDGLPCDTARARGLFGQLFDQRIGDGSAAAGFIAIPSGAGLLTVAAHVVEPVGHGRLRPFETALA